MREIRALDEGAYAFLMERDLATWCKADFQTATRCTSFENGILESFNAQILPTRVEVRKRDEAYGVNLITREYGCRLWNLSGVPCIHAVAAFMHFKLNPDIGMWRSTINTPPLPPIVKTLPGRPRKNRIKHPSELDDHHHVGDATMGRGSTHMGRGTISKRGRSAIMGRGSASKRGGSATMGRGFAKGSQSKRGRSTKMGRGSQSMRGGSTAMGRGSHNKRVGLQGKGVMIAAIQSLNQSNGNSKHPISQHAPTLLETTTEESHTPRAPRPRPIPRPQIKPRGKSERISKKRKFNYPEDDTGKTPNKPFSL
ncbi:hypothetical protein Tco_1028233 [Tanacetum coccineum]|uniref:Zinc finger PMZ-type domain-containing protein n=1 Tax=Tanacetum coccineum TaxID=301880 RepID=A0ABQ5G276_9ASTR